MAQLMSRSVVNLRPIMCQAHSYLSRPLLTYNAVSAIVLPVKFVHYGRNKYIKKDENKEETEERNIEDLEMAQNQMPKKKGLRRPQHSVDTSIRYVNSKVFYDAYNGVPPWRLFRRNIKGRDYMRKPRPNCVDDHSVYNTNHPCPVCRDEYFVLDYRNPQLLSEFMWAEVNEPVNWRDSHICLHQYTKLRGEIVKARMHGLLTFKVPYRVYDYREYYRWWESAPLEVEDEPSPYTLQKDESFITFPDHNREINKFDDPWWLRWDVFARKMK